LITELSPTRNASAFASPSCPETGPRINSKPCLHYNAAPVGHRVASPK
jgi:hypothetical protein